MCTDWELIDPNTGVIMGMKIVFCGAEGTRTPDPLHAMQVRYQLRHSPSIA